MCRLSEVRLRRRTAFRLRILYRVLDHHHYNLLGLLFGHVFSAHNDTREKYDSNFINSTMNIKLPENLRMDCAVFLSS